jgi:hypothetical protein
MSAEGRAVALLQENSNHRQNSEHHNQRHDQRSPVPRRRHSLLRLPSKPFSILTAMTAKAPNPAHAQQTPKTRRLPTSAWRNKQQATIERSTFKKSLFGEAQECANASGGKSLERALFEDMRLNFAGQHVDAQAREGRG